jgi:tetratricopeptide (TPR) repeat protein
VAELLRSDPNDTVALGTGWENRSLQGVILHGRGRREEAGAAFRQTLAHATRLYEQDPRDPERRRKLSRALLWVAGIHWEEGRHAAAAELARERLRLWPDDPAEVYMAARQLALCMRQASRGKGKAWRTADEQARRNLYAGETLAALRQAVRHGFRDREALLSAPELALLRGRADFKQLVAELAPAGK